MKHVVHALVVATFLVACAGGSGTVTSTNSPPPVVEGEVTATSGTKITATISAATLGEDCGGGSGAFAPSGDCAAESKGGCGGGCQQSNVQIAFTAGSGASAARIEVIGVKLVSATDGSEVDSLTASTPQSWNGSGYAAWNETVPPSSSLKASYNLTAPQWSTIENGKTSYSTSYRLHVTLRIDGTTITLTSKDLNREPMVAT
jgi:hypothetical protein